MVATHVVLHYCKRAPAQLYKIDYIVVQELFRSMHMVTRVAFLHAYGYCERLSARNCFRLLRSRMSGRNTTLFALCMCSLGHEAFLTIDIQAVFGVKQATIQLICKRTVDEILSSQRVERIASEATF